MKEVEKTSKEVMKKSIPDSPPIIVEDVIDKDEPTLERHLIEEDLIHIASYVVKDASLLCSPIIM